MQFGAECSRMLVLGSFGTVCVVILGTRQAMNKPWAWLRCAEEHDRVVYTEATRIRRPFDVFARLIGGVTRPEALPWVPESAQLNQANLRLLTGMLSMAAALLVLTGTLHPLLLSRVSVGSQSVVQALVTVAVVGLMVATLWIADRLSAAERQMEEGRALEALKTHRALEYGNAAGRNVPCAR